MESRIGQRWIAWVGAVVVFFSAAFFLFEKHAFDNDWIGPTGQVVTSALVGLAMLGCGSRFISKGFCKRVLGQCLMGLGLGILYATFFAAFSAYERPVMSRDMAFAFMVAVTAGGMALAVMHDALAIAFLAVLGGVLTPILVSTGQDARDALFAYLLLLNLGVLGVAFFRGWRLLDTLAMAGTFALYAGWSAKFYRPEGLGAALAWLGAFYAVFLVLPFLYHLVRKRSFTIERFIMALGNAAFAAGFAWHMLRQEYLFAMGFVALGMAAAYLVLGTVIRQRLPEDARALFGAIAMTVTFLTLAVPMQLRAHGIMLAWVAEAPVLAYLAYRFRHLPVRAFAAGVLVLAVGRLFLADVHWPLHTGLFVPFFNRQLLSALAVPAAAAWVQARTCAAVFLVAGVVGLLALLSAEVYSYCSDVITDHTLAPRAGQMSITLVWSVYAAGLLFVGFWRRWRWLRLGGLALFGVAAVKLVLVDLTHLRDVYRIVSFLVLGLLMLGASYLYHRLEKRLVLPKPGAAPAEPTPPVGEAK